MTVEQRWIQLYEVFAPAYRQEMTVKEFRQAIMEVARNSDNKPLKAAIMESIPHISNKQLEGIMTQTARVKAEVQRRMLMMLPDEPEEGAQS